MVYAILLLQLSLRLRLLTTDCVSELLQILAFDQKRKAEFLKLHQKILRNKTLLLFFFFFFFFSPSLPLRPAVFARAPWCWDWGGRDSTRGSSGLQGRKWRRPGNCNHEPFHWCRALSGAKTAGLFWAAEIARIDASRQQIASLVIDWRRQSNYTGIPRALHASLELARRQHEIGNTAMERRKRERKERRNK